jgi:hypothetical protein
MKDAGTVSCRPLDNEDHDPVWTKPRFRQHAEIDVHLLAGKGVLRAQ